MLKQLNGKDHNDMKRNGNCVTEMLMHVFPTNKKDLEQKQW